MNHGTILQLCPSRKFLDIRYPQLERVREPLQPHLQHLIPAKIAVGPQDEFRALDILSRKVRLEHPLLLFLERREVDPPIRVIVDPSSIFDKHIPIRP